MVLVDLNGMVITSSEEERLVFSKQKSIKRSRVMSKPLDPGVSLGS